jgi:hypothetical protein
VCVLVYPCANTSDATFVDQNKSLDVNEFVQVFADSGWNEGRKVNWVLRS